MTALNCLERDLGGRALGGKFEFTRGCKIVAQQSDLVLQQLLFDVFRPKLKVSAKPFTLDDVTICQCCLAPQSIRGYKGRRLSPPGMLLFIRAHWNANCYIWSHFERLPCCRNSLGQSGEETVATVTTRSSCPDNFLRPRPIILLCLGRLFFSPSKSCGFSFPVRLR